MMNEWIEWNKSINDEYMMNEWIMIINDMMMMIRMR